ncbi:MAG: thiamine-phosphate kinase [Thermoplasmatota archaeon]
MEISELGEVGLIERLSERIGVPDDLIIGIGDDCAVLENDKEYTLITTDMLVSGDHFRRDWHSPFQIGWKSMIVNVSDIAAMGGLPEYALISMALPEDVDVEYIDGIYDGYIEASDRYDFDIIGGDTTHGDILVINVVMIGKVKKENLCLRSDAEVGDIIGVTGDLGKSWAGLELLLAEKEGYTDFYLQPDCKLDAAEKLAPYVNAMIDVSDGLASEVNHICKESGVGALIEKSNIPISDRTKKAGEILEKDPILWALSGGEDFELIFTIPEDRIEYIQGLTPIWVGEIIGEGVYLIDGEKKMLEGGYDHFQH